MTTALSGAPIAPASPPDDAPTSPVRSDAAEHAHPHPGAVPTPGIYAGVPMDVYHSWNAASNSRLSKLRQSPAHLKAYLDEPREDTTSLKIGRAAHTSILEPDDFSRLFVVAQRCEGTKKDLQQCTNMGLAIDDHGEWRCGVHGKGLALDPSRITIGGDKYADCQRMREAVLGRVTSRALLTGPGDTELSIVWIDAETGVTCKARPDFANRIYGTLVDLKTTEDASESEFARSIYKWGYHRQSAFYLDGAAAVGLEMEHFTFIPVEKSAPYASATYRLTDGAVDAGRDELRRLLAIYAECMASNSFPGYPDEVRDVSLPDYAWKQIEVAA